MKPMDDPEYRIPGTRLFSFSRWSRENVPKPAPAHKIGDRVLVELAIHKVYEDCDGTPLFAIGSRSSIGTQNPALLHGYDNEALAPSKWVKGEPAFEQRVGGVLWAWCQYKGESYADLIAGNDPWPENATHWKPVVVPRGPEGRMIDER